VIAIVSLKTVLFTFLRNFFKLLAVNGHDINKISAEINFHLTKKKANFLRS
jgi:hypothetical protein